MMPKLCHSMVTVFLILMLVACTVAQLGTCQPDWELFGSFCYHVETEQRGSFSYASNFCQRLGGNLTSIHSPEEQAYHAGLVSKAGVGLWIGLHDITDEGHFEWIDGTPLNYKHWGQNQPDDWHVVGGEDCGHLATWGKWNDLPCSPINGFICKQPQTFNVGYCVLNETFTTGRVLTWPKTAAGQTAFSNETCGVTTDNSGLPLGTRYCRPTSEWGNVQIRNCYDETPTTAGPLTVPYVKTDKSKMCPSDVTQGGDGLLTWPETAVGDTAVSDETCPLGTSNAGYSLAVRHCSLSTSFQVQWDSGRMLSCSETETYEKEQVAGICQPDWELFGSFCYHLETEQKGSFSDATDFCQRLGGNLTSIHSPQEQAYHVELNRKAGQDIWIGLHDITDEGHFEWIDGTPLNYKSWEPFQPDDWDVVGGEDCVHLSHLDMWNDKPCSPIDGFICKQPQTVSAGYCVPDETYTTGGVLTWPTTKAGQTAFSNETCGVNTDNSGFPTGTRNCRLTSEWGNVQMLRCYDETKSKSSALKAGKTSVMSPGTKVAISLALVAVALTLLVFVITRRLRESNSYHAIGNVCGAIFILYLTLAAGIDATDNSTGCILVAAMLHYFSLVSLLWLAVEIRNSYGICSRSDEAQHQLQLGSLVKAYAAAWGIPAVVVAVTMIISFADYRNTDYCAFSAGPALFYGAVIPMLLIVIHNVITFICAFLALRRQPITHDAPAESLKNRDSWQRAQASLLVSVVFTISECFAYLHLINPSTIALRVLFSISVAVTGLSILGMFCLYLGYVRQAVLPNTWQREDQEMMVPFSFQNICDEGEEGHTNAAEIPDTKS